jgi:hypothetical protein
MHQIKLYVFSYICTYFNFIYHLLINVYILQNCKATFETLYIKVNNSMEDT